MFSLLGNLCELALDMNFEYFVCSKGNANYILDCFYFEVASFAYRIFIKVNDNPIMKVMSL